MKQREPAKIAPAMLAALNHMRQQAAAAWKIYQSTDNEDWRALDADEFVFELYARLSTSEARKETIAELNALSSES